MESKSTVDNVAVMLYKNRRDFDRDLKGFSIPYNNSVEYQK